MIIDKSNNNKALINDNANTIKTINSNLTNIKNDIDVINSNTFTISNPKYILDNIYLFKLDFIKEFNFKPDIKSLLVYENYYTRQFYKRFLFRIK